MKKRGNTRPAQSSRSKGGTPETASLAEQETTFTTKTVNFICNINGKFVVLVVIAVAMVYATFPNITTSIATLYAAQNPQTLTNTVTNSAAQGEVGNVPTDLPDEITNFKPKYQKSIQPKKTFFEGRRIVPMELLPQKQTNSSHSVRVFMFENFLSDYECDSLKKVHNKHIDFLSEQSPLMCFESIRTLHQNLQEVDKADVKVTAKDFIQGTRCMNTSFSKQLADWMNHNWSYSTAFYPGESKFSQKLEALMEETTGLSQSNGGKFQLTSYPQHISYKAHTDCQEDNADKRDRMGTILVYLDTVEQGGETEFLDLGIWVKPKKGRALVWNNMDTTGRCNPLSIHQAKKVIDGHKYILQRWYYYESFYSLGKRPPPPPLPKRSNKQAMVLCDEHKHGSCRWYDEWNYDNIDDYRKQKAMLI